MKYYKSDSRKISFREYCQADHSWRLFPAALFKILGILLPVNEGIPFPLPLRDNCISETEISAVARGKITPLLEQCQQLGFQTLCYQTLKERLLPSDIVIVSLLHLSNEITCRVFFSQVITGRVTTESLYCVIASWLNDGAFLMTSSRKPDLDSPSSFNVLRLVGASPKELLEAHSKRLDEIRVHNPPQLIPSLERYEQMADAIEDTAFRFNLERGVYVEMTPKEVESAKKRMEKWQVAGRPERQPKGIGHYLFNGLVVWFVFNLFCFYLLRNQLGESESVVRAGALPFCLIASAAWFFIVKKRCQKNEAGR